MKEKKLLPRISCGKDQRRDFLCLSSEQRIYKRQRSQPRTKFLLLVKIIKTKIMANGSVYITSAYSVGPLGVMNTEVAT